MGGRIADFSVFFESANAIGAKLHLSFDTPNSGRNFLQVRLKSSQSYLGSFLPPFTGNASVVRALTPMDHSFSAIVANVCHRQQLYYIIT